MRLKCDRCGEQLPEAYFRVWDNVDKFFMEDEFLCPDCFKTESELWLQCPVCCAWVPAEMVEQCCFFRKHRAA